MLLLCSYIKVLHNKKYFSRWILEENCKSANKTNKFIIDVSLL